MARNKSPFNYLAQLEKSEKRGLFEEVSNPLQKTTVPFASQAENNTQTATPPAIGTQKKVTDWDVNELLSSGNFINPGAGAGEEDPSGYASPPIAGGSTTSDWETGGGEEEAGTDDPGSGIGDPDSNPWDQDWVDDFTDCYAQWNAAQDAGYDGEYNEFASYYCGG